MQVECWYCGRLEAKDGYVAGFGAGPDGLLYVLECLGPKEESWINRHKKCDWRVRSIDAAGSQCVYLIRDQIRNYNLVQPLPDGLLLAGSRCQFFGTDTPPNADVFDFGGNLIRSLLLGDGIEKLQATAEGDIWAAYFDEGIFGNLGWTRPIGSPGLVRFDQEGNQVYRFEPRLGLNTIADCYALNAVSAKEAWCCYYTQFSIVQIVDDRVCRHWACPVRGAHELAVWRDVVAMPSGYQATNWTLLRLQANGNAESRAVLEFVDNSGVLLPPSVATCRGDAIWFVQAGEIYRTTLRDLRL